MLIVDPEDGRRGLCGVCGGPTVSLEVAKEALRDLMMEQVRLRKEGL